MIKKIISYKSKNNEREKSDSNEVYELPMPIVDAICSTESLLSFKRFVAASIAFCC